MAASEDAAAKALQGKAEAKPHEADDGVVPVLKKPAGAAKEARKSRGRKVASAHEALLERPSTVARPPQTEMPTAHAGGKIYWSKPKHTYRVYLRTGDRVEKVVAADPSSRHDMKNKFLVCCSLIENDKRPAPAR